MKDGKIPDPNIIHPIAGYDKEIFVKPTVNNPNIIIGDFTYIADSDTEDIIAIWKQKTFQSTKTNCHLSGRR